MSADAIDSVGSSNNRELRFGNTEKREYSLPTLNTLTQVRHSLDANAVDELKTSLVVRDIAGEIVATDLMNMVSVADLDERHALAYLAEINEARGTRHTLDELTSYVDQDTRERRWAIIIDGHTRTESMRQLGEEAGCKPQNVFAWGTVYKNISYTEAVRRQIGGNKTTRSKEHEEAELIVDYFKLFAKRARLAGQVKDYTPSQCARALGISLIRVNNALAYEILPDSVKMLVARGRKNGGITYSLAVKHLSEYQLALRGAAEAKFAEGDLDLGEFGSPTEQADHELFVFTITLLQKILAAGAKTRGHGSEETSTDVDFDPSPSGVIKYINGEIEKLTAETKYVQPSFDLDDLMIVETFRHTRRRSQMSVQTLGRTAAGVLAFLADVAPDQLTQPGVLAPADARALGKLLTEYADRQAAGK